MNKGSQRLQASRSDRPALCDLSSSTFAPFKFTSDSLFSRCRCPAFQLRQTWSHSCTPRGSLPRILVATLLAEQ
jgi:hypothetical protein